MTQRRPVSHTEFARDIGCHYTLVTRYRNGERLPTVENIAKMVELYGLEPMELIAAVNRANEKGPDGEKTDPMAFARYLRDHIFTIPAEGGQDAPVPSAAPLLETGMRLNFRERVEDGVAALTFGPEFDGDPTGPLALTLGVHVGDEAAGQFAIGGKYRLMIRAAD